MLESKVPVGEFFELAEKLRKLGASAVQVGQMRVEFYPPEPAPYVEPERAPRIEEEPSTRRGRIRRELEKEAGNLYGSA